MAEWKFPSEKVKVLCDESNLPHLKPVLSNTTESWNGTSTLLFKGSCVDNTNHANVILEHADKNPLSG